MATSSKLKRKILIVGAGFGGVRTARKLAKNRNLEVTLVSTEDSFTYFPQLYHSASGGGRAQSSIPLSEIFAADRNITIAKDKVTKFDPDGKNVTGESGKVYAYDELVLSLGGVTNYFGLPGLPEFSYDIKSIAGAEKFKAHLHNTLSEDKKPDGNYVIVGGGPTGIELAAALSSYLYRITKLHGIDRPKYNIVLVEAAPRLLPRLPESYSNRVKTRLESLGITVRIGATVQGQTADALQLAGEAIVSKSVVWTAGVANNPFFKENAALFTLAKNGKVEVDGYLQGRPNVYVIGDNANTQFTGMAQTAISNADFVAEDIDRVVKGSARVEYKPKAPVSVIPVGAHWASAQWGKLLFYGYSGYLLRRGADLIGYCDVESVPKALKVLLDESRLEDNCDVCQPGKLQPAKAEPTA